MSGIDVDRIHAKIQHLKKDAEQLRELGEEFAAVRKNADRMLACIKMLELNVSDLYTLQILCGRKQPEPEF